MCGAGSNFSDPDGNAHSGFVVQWKRGGSIIATNRDSASYTTVGAGANKSLTAELLWLPPPSTTEPSSGAWLISSAAAVLLAGAAIVVGNFLPPSAQTRTWSSANSYCQGMGARRPKMNELQQLFVSATTSPTFFPNSGYIQNAEMCSNYGGLLDGQCGGSNGYYWSRTLFVTGAHYGVNLYLGTASDFYDSSTGQVACVR